VSDYQVKGALLFSEVEITHRRDLRFSILGIKTKDGQFIKYELTQRCIEGKDGFVIPDENTREDNGRDVETLFFKTGSEVRPSIPIYITGIIQ
jgi:hypothetical protein